MFDELRIRSLLKKEISVSKYKSLPEKIRMDERVIEHLIKCDPKNISILSNRLDVSKFVLVDYSLLDYLNEDQLRSVFKKLDLSKVKVTKEIFDKLYSADKEKLFIAHPKECFCFYDDKKRMEVFYELLLVKVKDDKDSIFYDLFTEEELKIMLLNLEEQEYDELFKLAATDYITTIVTSFSEEDLMSLYNRFPLIYEYLSDDLKDVVSLNLAGDNISKILELSEKAQYEFFSKDLHLLKLAPKGIIRDYIGKIKSITCDQFVFLTGGVYWSDLQKMPKEELLKAFAYDAENMFFYCDRRDRGMCLSLFIHEKLELIDDVNIREKYKQLFEKLTVDRMVPPKPYGYVYSEKYQIAKLLLDEKVLMNNSPDLIQEYINTFDNKILCEMLTNAYGNHVKDIFKVRPNLGLTDIECLSLLSPDIYNVLGSGFVNYALNCNLRTSNYLIYLMANDKDLLNVFNKYFNTMTSDIENLDINTISNLVDKFLLHKELLKDIDYDNLSEERKRNINLLLSDVYIITAHIRTTEDLDNYLEIREKRFLEFVDSLDSCEDVKNYLLAYVTGRDVKDTDCEFTLEGLTLQQIIKSFDINRIVNDEELIKKMNLNKDDVSILLLLCEVERNYDIDVLKNVFKSLISRGMDEHLLAPTFDKIRKYCVEDVKNNLVSSTTLDKMEKKVVDGVEVVSFDGDSFSLITSYTGTNLSDTCVYPERIKGKNLLDSWLHKENGLVTISTALVSSDTSIYPASSRMWRELEGHMALVFDNDVEILGMGGSDISSSHVQRSKVHAFNHIMHNDFGFSSMDELKRRANKNAGENPLKFDTEVTIGRYIEDIRSENSGKRVMPIGIYVIGEITPEVLETAKVFNEYYEQNGLGKFRIIQVDPKVYRGEGVIVSNSSKKKGDEVNGKNI